MVTGNQAKGKIKQGIEYTTNTVKQKLQSRTL
jgi:uncharacterized protein YjbJ (UPF0337 family)